MQNIEEELERERERRGGEEITIDRGTVINNNKFDHKLLKKAHQFCYESVKQELERGKSTVVSNTMTSKEELKEYEDLAVEYATKNGRASRQNYKYSGMRSHMEALKSRSDLFDTDKWISKLLNGFKGTHELNHIGGGRNPKFHYISFQNALYKSGK